MVVSGLVSVVASSKASLCWYCSSRRTVSRHEIGMMYCLLSRTRRTPAVERLADWMPLTRCSRTGGRCAAVDDPVSGVKIVGYYRFIH